MSSDPSFGEAPKRRLAMIPARSGSKGVPGKNLRVVAGQSLLARAIAVAQETGLFDRIYVSTDSDAYIDEAAEAGVDTPFKRPADLATDESLVADAIRHALDSFAARGESYDTLALLEPTSPLRTAEIVRETVDTAETDGWDAAFTVSPVAKKYHPLKQLHRSADGALSFCLPNARPNVNRQELDRSYVRNGLCYAIRVSSFLETHSLHGTRAKGILFEGDAISIDSLQDLNQVRQLLRDEAQTKGLTA
ncbi:MAG: acylneuraminate cytidylyltransferase family protein [Pseudomonadota bacterium]